MKKVNRQPWRVSLTVLTALAGLADSASAAGVTFYFQADRSTGAVGDTVTWIVSARTSGLGPDGYFGGFVGSFRATNADAYTVTNITPLMQGIGTTPTSNSGSINSINMFHSALLGTDDNANPLTIMIFDVVAGARAPGRSLTYTADGVASLFATDFILEPVIELEEFDVVSDTFLILPGPGWATPLAMGTLVGLRRRR